MAWLYQRPGSAFWWIGHREGRTMFRQSTKKVNREDAEKELAKVEAMLAAKKAGTLTESFYRFLNAAPLTNLSLHAALNDWLKEIQSSRGEKTYIRYKGTAEQLLSYLKADEQRPLLRDMTGDHIARFLQSRRSVNSASSVNVARKILSGFFNRAITRQEINSNPVRATKTFKAAKREKMPRRAFTPDELKGLLTAAPNEFWKYMILGGLYTGLRLGDLICLSRGEIDLANNRLRLEATKTGRELEIPLAPAFRTVIEKRLPELKPDANHLWPDKVKTYQKRGAGPFSNEFYDDILTPCKLVPPRPKKHKKTKGGRGAQRQLNATTFHSLRHTFVSLLKSSGAHQSVVKELAGHSSDAVNDLYTHVDPGLMEKAIKALPEVTQ